MALAQTWNPSQTNADITLSGGNLIGTHSATNAGTDAPMFALQGKTTGRYYWELTVTGGANLQSGVGNTSSGTTTGSYLGNSTATAGWGGDGVVFANNGTGATWATYASGNTLCLALDLVSGKMWGRVGAAGNWNNAVIGSQNPAVGSQVGGYTLLSGVTAAPVVPAQNLRLLNDTVTVKFANSSWIGVPPAGFSSFDVTYIPAPLNMPLPQRTEIIGY